MRFPPLAPRDRAAAHRLAAAVLRRMGTLDAVLEPFLRKAPPEPVRHVLRLGAAGLLLLETPSHAAVSTAVALARTRGLAPFAGLVNAVLRRVAEAGAAALADLDGPRLDTPGLALGVLGRQGTRDRHRPSARGTARPDAASRDAGRPGGSPAADRFGALSRPAPASPRSARLRARRLLGAGRRRRLAGQAARGAGQRTRGRSVRRARRQDGAARRGRCDGGRGRARPRAAGAAAGEPAALAICGPSLCRPTPPTGPRRAVRRRAAGRAVQCHRNDPPPSRRAAPQAAARRARADGNAGPAAAGRHRHAPPGRPADLLGVLAAARGGRAARRGGAGTRRCAA